MRKSNIDFTHTNKLGHLLKNIQNKAVYHGHTFMNSDVLNTNKRISQTPIPSLK